MRFLKKASYKDILGDTKGTEFRHHEDITSRYRDLELFLRQKDLKELLSNQDDCFSKLINKLKQDGAVISAIHCPESYFKTYNDGDDELSENYLSLCEVMSHDDSKKLFKDLLILADKICKESPDNEENSKKEIIVVLHEGCKKGCSNNDEQEFCTNWSTEDVAGLIDKIIEEKELNSTIKIALENITPFYSTTGNRIEKGQNCGWKFDNQISKKDFFDDLNGKLKEKSRKIQFGDCVDFCHIMVSDQIMGGRKGKSEVIEDYFNSIDYKDNIFLFHVSNYGENLSHGQIFSFEREDDKKAVETIRKLCNEYNKEAPITFEMADGMDVEKAAMNYEHIMFFFSKKHLFGRFGEILGNEKNKELKEFFDELFSVYSRDKKDIFEITSSLWKIKQIILKNTFIQDEKERLFGVDFDKTEVNLSLARLKAYIYYTRFCNLGNYLADNYYSGDNLIWGKEDLIDKEFDALIAEDFGLSMKYFMFNDKIHQCTYTGIRFKFLIDFLPKKVGFYRLNDGIKKVNPMKLSEDNILKEIVDKIPGHINGTSIINGKADFYSVGKNFEQCLFKYFDPSLKDWSLKIYENKAINYVDYNGKRYSIQAFTQLALSNKGFVEKGKIIDVSLDISRFSGKRDGSETYSLDGFLKFITEKGIQKEKVASISDEEILVTKLPESNESSTFTLSEVEGLILKKIVLKMAEKRTDKFPSSLEVDQKNLLSEEEDWTENELEEIEKIKKEIERINNTSDNQIREILKAIKRNFENLDLRELVAYRGSHQNYFIKFEHIINCKFQEGKNA